VFLLSLIVSPPSADDGVRYRNTFAWKFVAKSRCGTSAEDLCMHRLFRLRELPEPLTHFSQQSKAKPLFTQSIDYKGRQNKYNQQETRCLLHLLFKILVTITLIITQNITQLNPKPPILKHDFPPPQPHFPVPLITHQLLQDRRTEIKFPYILQDFESFGTPTRVIQPAD
jgi:hypothetical protein